MIDFRLIYNADFKFPSLFELQSRLMEKEARQDTEQLRQMSFLKQFTVNKLQEMESDQTQFQ